ncbi:MAG: hypothetical protein HY074_08280 [Deltaproteobacteria bacterium]|nr:hypothetical protein [Deltaproteobacteria bacterium]
MKKKYETPTLTKVVLNPAQAVLSVCSTSATPTKLPSLGAATCKGTGSTPQRCKKTAPGGDNAGTC